MSNLLEEMGNNLVQTLLGDINHLDEAKRYFKSALGHTGRKAETDIASMLKEGKSEEDVIERLIEKPLHDLENTLGLAEIAQTAALISIAKSLQQLIMMMESEG